ncbi:MAG: uL30 family ribosomal protein [Candidatus Woesearchaeota archaeon]
MSKETSKKTENVKVHTKKIAVVMVRGRFDMCDTELDTLDMLKLYRKNFCSVVNDTPAMKGMIHAVKDFVTFGNIDDETFKMLVDKRGEEYKGPVSDDTGRVSYKRKYFEFNGKKYKPYFRLNPPTKGFGRKGVKIPFVSGGALGDRKEKINDLIKRML